MVLEKVPFQNYTLDEDKQPQNWRNLTIRLDETDEAYLASIKQRLNVKGDGSAIRLCIDIAENVTSWSLPRKKRAWLFKRDRVRLSDKDG